VPQECAEHSRLGRDERAAAGADPGRQGIALRHPLQVRLRLGQGVRAVRAAHMGAEDADYDGVLIPGGHGPMQDLAVDPDIARILQAMLPDQSKVVASLCHGPAAFMSAGDPGGDWLFKGRKVTAFTDEEEQQVGLAANAPWLLEERLRGAGAEFSSGPAWGPFVVVDGNLVTGQNPASGAAAAEAVLKELAARA
jgi:putative intracellular protease/amidase